MVEFLGCHRMWGYWVACFSVRTCHRMLQSTVDVTKYSGVQGRSAFFSPSSQVDELTMTVNEISLLVEKIKRNHTVILASIQDHGMSAQPHSRTMVCQPSLIPEPRYVSLASFQNHGTSAQPHSRTMARQPSLIPEPWYVSLASFQNNGMSASFPVFCLIMYY